DFLEIAVQVASQVPALQFLVQIFKKGFSVGFLSAIDDGVDAGQLLEIVLDLVEKYRVHDAAQDQAQRGVFSALPVKGDFLAGLGPVVETNDQYLLGTQLNRGGKRGVEPQTAVSVGDAVDQDGGKDHGNGCGGPGMLRADLGVIDHHVA